jgi:RB1-inducible coiled-coil protein 1
VASLQNVIAREYAIPEDKQVLLISGGDSLDPAATVGKYHAGTVGLSPVTCYRPH